MPPQEPSWGKIGCYSTNNLEVRCAGLYKLYFADAISKHLLTLTTLVTCHIEYLCVPSPPPN